MMAVYNRHLLLSGTPVLKFKERRWHHTPTADTPHSHASSTYDLEDSFLAQGQPCFASVNQHSIRQYDGAAWSLELYDAVLL